PATPGIYTRSLPTLFRSQRDVLKLSQSAAFKREVLGRYVPLFASFVRDDAPEMGTGLSAYQEWLAAPLWGDEFEPGPRRFLLVIDRKSTRLNSSHVKISY